MKNIITVLAIGAGISLGLTSCKQAANTTAKTEARPDSVVKKDSSHLIGLWLDQDIKTEKGEQVAYELVSQGKKNYIQVITFTEKKLNIDDNPTISPSASELKKSDNKYISIDRPNEIYMIGKKGELLIYDEKGLVAVCKRML